MQLICISDKLLFKNMNLNEMHQKFYDALYDSFKNKRADDNKSFSNEKEYVKIIRSEIS